MAPIWKTSLRAFQAAANRVFGREVALHELRAQRTKLVRLPRRADQRDHVVAPLRQLAGHVASNESRGSGDEGTHARHSIPTGLSLRGWNEPGTDTPARPATARGSTTPVRVSVPC